MSYVNDISVWGLMNGNASVCDKYGVPAYYRTKSKNKLAVCNESPIQDEELYDEVNYMYLDEKPDSPIKSSCMDEIVSVLDSRFFEGMSGKEFNELRHTRNQYINKIEVRSITSENIEDVLAMIERWRYEPNGGVKYMWQEHAGIDKALIRRYVENITEWDKKVIMRSFWLNGTCIGYSCIERFPSNMREGIHEHIYLTRKVINARNTRNITEFIDWYTFNELYRLNNNPSKFLINWGCSSGGVHWYKTHKWPVYSLIPKWFYKYKKEK